MYLVGFDGITSFGGYYLKVDIQETENNYATVTKILNAKKNGVASGKTFYEYLQDKQYTEYLGVYQENTTDPHGHNVNSENKTTYRIITYVQN